MENRNYTIDFLRFFAAFWVALFHFNEPIEYVDNWYREVTKLGHVGIPIFFVISGYCILLTASRSKHALDFLARRLFRIMPAYWFSLVLVLIAVLAQKIILGNNSVAALPKDFISITAVITLLTYPFSLIPTINWVYWSLTYELFFYLVVTISLLLSNYYRSFFLLFISFLALIIPVEPHGSFFFLNHWPAFALGVGVYFFYSKHDFNQFIFAILLIAISLVSLIKNFLLQGQLAYFLAVFIGTVLVIVSHHVKIRENKASKLGDYSYAVYLIHIPIGVYLIGLMKTQVIQKNIILNIGFDLFTYVIITILSFLIFQYIEKPMIRIGRQFSKKHFDTKGSDKQEILLEIDPGTR